MSLIKLLWHGFEGIIALAILWDLFGGFIKLVLDVIFVCGIVYIGYNCYKLYEDNH